MCSNNNNIVSYINNNIVSYINNNIVSYINNNNIVSYINNNIVSYINNNNIVSYINNNIVSYINNNIVSYINNNICQMVSAQQGFVLRSHLKPFEVENLVEISEEGQPNKAIYDISNDNDDNSLSASSNLVDCADEGSCEVDSDEDVIRHDDVDDNDACKEKLGADDNDISENKDSKTGQ